MPYGAKNSDRQIQISPIPTYVLRANSPNLMLVKLSCYTVLLERTTCTLVWQARPIPPLLFIMMSFTVEDLATLANEPFLTGLN